MAEIYILSQHDELLASLSEETGLISTRFKEEVNRLPEDPFTFTVDATTENAQHVREENQVVFADKDGDLRLYVIKELDENGTGDSAETTAICEPAFMELKEKTVVDRRFVNTNAQPALNAALEGTRWTGTVETELGTATTNFYYDTSVDAIWRILDVWGGEFKDVVEFDGNRITARKIRILQRRGADNGKRFDIEHNIDEIQRTVLSYPVTAIYGRGASLPIEDDEGEETGGFTRYIDFADVVWRKSAGDPVDKPLGQRWVGDPDALQKYGRQHNGQLLHREAVWQNGDYEDPAELLMVTWEQLQKVNKAEVNYRLSAFLLESFAGYEHEKVSLGDTARVIDRDFARPIEIQARVIGIEYDLLNIDDTATVEMGQFLSAHEYDDTLDRVVRDINDNRGRWEQGAKPISPDSYPDIVPSVPSNLEAAGAFKTVQLHWSFNLNEVYVRAYELYASQVAGFVPSPETMVYRGTLNGFIFNGNTDTTYYFRVRAVNYHGRYSAFSGQVSATTARVLTDDIMFGPEMAEKLRELEIIANDSIDLDKIKQEVFDKIEQDRKRYTSQEIAHVENALNQELRDRAKIEDVNREFKRINDNVAEGKETLDQVSKDLLDMDKDFKSEFKVLEDGLSGKISSGEVSSLLGDKVDVSIYESNKAEIDFSIDGLKTSFENANTRINNVTGEIEAVEKRTTNIEATNKGFLVDINELKNQEIGGQNIARSTEQNFPVNGWQGSTNTIERNVRVDEWNTNEAVRVRSNGGSTSLKSHITVLLNTEKMPGNFYTMSAWVKNNNDVRCTITNNNAGSIIVEPGESKRVSVTFVANQTSHIQFSMNAPSSSHNIDMTVWRIQLEEGNKMTGYQKPIKDLVDLPTYSARQTLLDTTIDGIAGRVGATESGLSGVRDTQAQFQLDLNGFTTSVRDLQTGLNGKVDSKTYTDRQTSLDSTIQGITGRVSTTENGINGLSSRVGTLELTDSQFSTRISSIETGLTRKMEEHRVNFNGITSSTDYVILLARSNVTGTTNYVNGTFHGRRVSGHVATGKVEIIFNNNSSGTLPVGYIQATTIQGGDNFTLVTCTYGGNSYIALRHRPNDQYRLWDTGTIFVGAIGSTGESLLAVQTSSVSNVSNFSSSQPVISPITKVETAIEQKADSIELRATQTDVSSLTGRMSTAEGRITTQAGQIDLKVSRDGIVSAINITPESIRINGALIRITGQTIIDNAVIKAAMIESGAVGTLAIANASISRGKLQEAIITNAYIAEATIQNSKIANLSADKINAGTLRAINITGVTITGSTITSVRGTNSMTIEGGAYTSTGRYTRTWKGTTRTSTVETRFLDGHLRFRDQQASQSLFYGPFGISTFMDGEGEYQDLPGSSGTIEWWDTTYSPGNANGITMSSYGGAVGLKSDLSHVVIDSGQSAQITSRNSVVYINPKTSKSGNNNFWFNLLDNTNDGFMMYGSLETQPNVGLRLSKAGNTISVVDGNYNRGGNTGFDVGTVYTNNIYKRESNTTVYWNGSSSGNTSINAPGDILRASGIRANTGSSDIFLATNDGAVRVTDGNGFNEGRGISYRPLACERVATMSSREFKENIETLDAIGLEVVNALHIVTYDLKTNPNAERQVGLIAEDSPMVAMLDNSAIDQYRLTSYNTKAIQELDTKVEYIEDELSVLRIENQIMKKKISELERKIA